jgi:hypothetical protein
VSRTIALGIAPDKRPVDLAEFRNGHGWSPSIWQRLVKATYGFDGYLFLGEGQKHLHNLWSVIEELPEWQQAPLVLTFDTGIVPWQAYEWAAEHLDEFDARLPAPMGHVNHVPAMADLLRSKPEVPAFGVYGMSVSDNPFDPIDHHESPGGCDRWVPCGESGYCEGHGSGLPFRVGVVYVLEQHRNLLAIEPPEDSG